MSYHTHFAPAPIALVSGISATCGIPSIVGARVGRDGSIYLDVFENDDYYVRPEQLRQIADFCGVELEDVEYEDGPDVDTVTVVVKSSIFDFSLQYGEPVYIGIDLGEEEQPPLHGAEDSEEGIQALVALALSRRA